MEPRLPSAAKRSRCESGEIQFRHRACRPTLACATHIDADGVFDADADGVGDVCDQPACCGAAGPVAPLGLVIGMLLLSCFGKYSRPHRRIQHRV